MSSDEGYALSDMITATTYLCLCLIVLTLDSCECSKRFHRWAFTAVFLGLCGGCYLASFVWTDSIIAHGTDSPSGIVGRFTKLGMRRTIFVGMIGLMLPAMITAWRDSEHQKCYLLRDFKFKADLV